MAQPGNSVQVQLELSNSILLGKDFLGTLLRVCVEDDVQPLAASVMEGLGDILLVSRQRIEEAQGLFNPKNATNKAWAKRKLLKAATVMAGVGTKGWPDALSKSISLTKTFLLATSFKVCFNDSEIGEMLYEMVWLGREAQKTLLSPDQACEFVGGISGLSDSLIPFEHYVTVVNAISQRLSSPAENTLLFESLPVRRLGQILVHVFEALRDEEISQVSLEGARNGYLLAATLSWLLPENTVCLLDDYIVFGRPGARLAIRLVKGQEEWHIGQWKQEDQLKPIIVHHETSLRSLQPSLVSHTALQTARVNIATQLELSSEALEEGTGVLAAALINVAYRKGLLYSDISQSTEKLSAVCSTNFRTSHANAMSRYGWIWDDSTKSERFTKKVNSVTEALYLWLEPMNSHRNLTVKAQDTFIESITIEILECNIAYYDQYNEPLVLTKVDDCPKIIQPAVYLAGDALLTAFAAGGSCSPKVFRPLNNGILADHAEMLFRMIFEPYSTDQVREGGPGPYLFSDFWLKALKTAVPGYHETEPGDLAIARNGYVAYAQVLEKFSTRKQDVSMIVTIPGTLRRHGADVREEGRAKKLVEILARGELCGRSLQVKPEVVQPFPNGRMDVKIEPKEDPAGIRLQYLVDKSSSEKVFRLATILKSPLTETSIIKQGIILPSGITNEDIAPASWADSIEAIAFAQHVDMYEPLPMQPEAERDQAQSWVRDKIFDEIFWHTAGKYFPPRYSISMTAGDDELRFFEAGFLAREANLFVRHDATLMTCLAVAIASKNTMSRTTEKRWAILA